MKNKEAFRRIKQGKMLLRAIDNKTRHKFINFLEKKSGVTGVQLTKQFNLSHGTVANHLKILKNAGLVKQEKSGKFVYFFLNKSRMFEIVECANVLLSIPSRTGN